MVGRFLNAFRICSDGDAAMLLIATSDGPSVLKRMSESSDAAICPISPVILACLPYCIAVDESELLVGGCFFNENFNAARRTTVQVAKYAAVTAKAFFVNIMVTAMIRKTKSCPIKNKLVTNLNSFFAFR